MSTYTHGVKIKKRLLNLLNCRIWLLWQKHCQSHIGLYISVEKKIAQPIGPTALSPTYFSHSLIRVLFFQQHYWAVLKKKCRFCRKQQCKMQQTRLAALPACTIQKQLFFFFLRSLCLRHRSINPQAFNYRHSLIHQPSFALLSNQWDNDIQLSQLQPQR